MSENFKIKKWVEVQEGKIWLDDLPWSIRGKILEPIFLPHIELSINRNKIREALLDTKALFAYWTDDWNRASESEWWWTICDDINYDINNLENSSGKRGIRKGLSMCSVHRIEINEFADITYSIFAKSQKSYGLNDSQIQTKEQYKNKILRFGNYDGFETWGAFTKEGLAAFASCVFIDNAVSLGSTKSDPELHKYYPNNALFYYITKHYLQERGAFYITNGNRTLLHSTTINDFLIRMGYRKKYCRLNIELTRKSKILSEVKIIALNRYLKLLWKKFPNPYQKLEAFYKLIEISKTF